MFMILILPVGFQAGADAPGIQLPQMMRKLQHLMSAEFDGTGFMRGDVTGLRGYDTLPWAQERIQDGSIGLGSSRQKEYFRKLSRNKRFYVSRVSAVGPDGITRTLPQAMEIIVK